jgi:FKBP-type peptidyl-prolyl cis-trans isomerases 2
MEIKIGKFVAVNYKLWGVEPGEEPEEIEETQPGNPLTFVYGTGLMLESFEKNLENLKAGDKFDFVLSASEAYGNVEPDNIIDLPKEVFFVDGKFDDEMVVEGAILPMRDQQGNTINGVVDKITDNAVTMDFNHPLAGTDLHFVGEVVEVREAREEDFHACAGGCGGGNCGGGDCSDNGCNGCCH